MNLKSYIMLSVILFLSYELHAADTAREDILLYSPDKTTKFTDNNYVTFKSGNFGNQPASLSNADEMSKIKLQDRIHIKKHNGRPPQQFFEKGKPYCWERMEYMRWQQLPLKKQEELPKQPEQTNPHLRTIKDIVNEISYYEKQGKLLKSTCLCKKVKKTHESLLKEQYMHVVTDVAALQQLQKRNQNFEAYERNTQQQLKKMTENIRELRKAIPIDIIQRLDANVETRAKLLRLIRCEDNKTKVESRLTAEKKEQEKRTINESEIKNHLFDALSDLDKSALSNDALYKMALDIKRRKEVEQNPGLNATEITLTEQEFANYIKEFKLRNIFVNLSDEEYELLKSTFPAQVHMKPTIIKQENASSKPPKPKDFDCEEDEDLNDTENQLASDSKLNKNQGWYYPSLYYPSSWMSNQ